LITDPPYFDMRLYTFLAFFSSIFLFSKPATGQLYSKFNGTSNTALFSAGQEHFQLLYLPSDIETPPNSVVKTLYFRKNGGSVAVNIANLEIRLGCVSASGF
jgi:hypothetical protein